MNLFTYGSLLFPEVMTALTRRTHRYEDLTLSGFERRKLRGKRYPGLVERLGAAVDGRVYFNIGDEAQLILDQFESSFYERRRVTVMSNEQLSITAIVYTVPPDFELVEDEPWNREEFEALHLPQYLKMCEQFSREFKASGGLYELRPLSERRTGQ